MPDSELTLENAEKFGLTKDEIEEFQEILQRNLTTVEAYIICKADELFYDDYLETKINQLIKESGIALGKEIHIDETTSCLLEIESALSLKPDKTYIDSATSTINLYRNLISQKAKPISGINSFHFSEPNFDSTKSSLTEFINGSSSYSNAFGAPVVGIQAYFSECNLNKPMLNSFLIGITKKNNDEIINFSKPNDIILIISPESNNSFNSIIYEKMVHETINEALETNLVSDLQALTNYGFIQSCIKFISKTNFGLQISLDQLSEIQQTEEIETILHSKSIASFLITCERTNCAELTNLMIKNGVNCTEIGYIIENPQIIILNKLNTLADLPIKALQRKIKAGEDIFSNHPKVPINDEFDISKIPVQKNLREIAWFLIKHPNIISKKWIFEQFDSTVGISNMSTNFPSSAALVNLKENDIAIALSLELNSRYIKANPEKGIQIAVAEAARKIVCTGAKPTAVIANFNFIKTNKKTNDELFNTSLKGLVKACKAFKTQITQVKTDLFEIPNIDENTVSNCQVPIIGMLGTLKDKNHQMTISFKNKGNIIFLIGQSKEDISSSEYLYSYHQVKNSPAPRFDLNLEHQVQCAVQELIVKNYVCSVHSVSRGGLIISLVESAMLYGLGFDIITDTDIRTDAFLFGEAQGRILVSITPNKEDHFIDFMLKKEIPFLALGHVTKGEMRVDDISFGFIEDAKREYENTFEKLLSV